MGSTSTTSFGHQFRIARNPWDLERFTGGSSSGSGAATAGFLCATSLGEDTGGSIRFPASWCGLVGIIPTWGRVSRYGLMTGIWSLDTIGPICRTVEDCAMTLQAIAGYDPNDQYTWNVPVPDYQEALDGNIKSVRVGVLRELFYSGLVDNEVRGSVAKAVHVLEELGASVEEVSIPLSAHAQTILAVLRTEISVHYRELIRQRLQEIGPGNRSSYLTGSIIPAQAYYKAQKLRSLLRQQVLEVLERVDVLVLPTTGVPAQTIEPDPGMSTSAGHPGTLTHTFSLASTTALSICCGFTSQNLPIGLQIAGRRFDEGTVLRVAHAYEQSTSWHTVRPPGF